MYKALWNWPKIKGEWDETRGMPPECRPKNPLPPRRRGKPDETFLDVILTRGDPYTPPGTLLCFILGFIFVILMGTVFSGKIEKSYKPAVGGGVRVSTNLLKTSPPPFILPIR